MVDSDRYIIDITEIQNCGKPDFPKVTPESDCVSFQREEGLAENGKVRPLQREGDLKYCTNRGCIFFDVTRLCEAPMAIAPTLTPIIETMDVPRIN